MNTIQHIAKKAKLDSTSSITIMQKAYLDILRSTRVVSHCPVESSLNVGTHDGSFHCDEALAISMLKLLPTYEHAVVVRTRKYAFDLRMFSLLISYSLVQSGSSSVIL